MVELLYYVIGITSVIEQKIDRQITPLINVTVISIERKVNSNCSAYFDYKNQ